MKKTVAKNILELKNLSLRFGGLTAVNQLSFSVREGEIFSLIGPNGAGKTSVFNAITGIYIPTEGKIFFANQETLKPWRILTTLGIIGIALATGLGMMVTANVQTLWEASIIDNYVYQQAFPWRRAFQTFVATLRQFPFSTLWMPIIVGTALGGAGALSVCLRSRRSPEVVCGHGIARTFQNIRLFQQLTVLENVQVGMHTQLKTQIWDAALRLPRHFSEQRRIEAVGLELLEFVGLVGEAHLPAASLSYGHQRRLEIARALATEPKLLLLDEPAAGMNPAETASLMELITKIRDRGLTVLLIEHHMKVVMGISDRIVVLDYGNKIAEGIPDEIKENCKVIEAYLGKEAC